MKEIIERGATSQIVHVFIPDSASTTGGGKTGLTEASAGLKIVVMRPGEASPTKYLQSAGNIETITTIGTYQAPTAGKCRFKEIDATDLPGWYELHFADALFNTTSSRRSLGGMISGASGVAPTPFAIQLSDPVRGVGSPTALPNGAANGAGGLPISTAGGLALDTLLANLDAAISSRMATFTLPTNFAALGINASGHISQVSLVDSVTALAANAIIADALSAAAVAKIEAALLNEGDGQALIDAIVQAIDAADIDTDILPALIRDAILNRVLSGNHETAGSVGKLIQNLDVLLSSRAPEAGGNLATLLTRIVGTLAAGTHQPQGGDAHAIVSSGTHGNAALKTLIDAAKVVVDAILEDTGTTGVPVIDKTGFKLAADGLDSIDASQPAGVAANWPEMLVLLYRRFFKKVTHDTNTGEIKTFADDGTTPLTTQAATESGGVETQGAAT